MHLIFLPHIINRFVKIRHKPWFGDLLKSTDTDGINEINFCFSIK